jgi:quercetin dioxygenase-like cupin family protein
MRVFKQRADTFTGNVWGENRITDAETNVRVNSVEFLPNSRTYWHHHTGGQVLVVTAGRGWVGTRDGTVVEVAAGDVIWTPPNVDHYHGARDDSFMLHDAISLGNTVWLEPVADADYGPKK